ncbi:HD-GYP domain-containing protein [Ammoniphilus sp. CFH 90114]|uniref:HD-GYP domain-containing protein n=1 Tax=Ammoniphilus sp. CFH 90114 TaxID=2493665 RepID=UPI0013E957C6|nr:HD-GYP domain-containing protein [Ammoniphilus sp. CFH 90114]
MPQVLVAHLKPGYTLSADVVTPLGGLLFEKGRKIYEREIEILKAFFVEEVTVEEQQPQQPKVKPESKSTTASPSREEMEKALLEPVDQMEKKSPPLPKDDVPKAKMNAPVTFEQRFRETVQWFKTMFLSVRDGQPIPIKELQEKLAELIRGPLELSNIMNTLKQNYPIEDYTYFHSISVSYLSSCIARWSRVAEAEIMSIALTGALHDIGKSKIDPSILYKPEKLTILEMKELRKYPVYGYHLVKAIPAVLEGVTLGVLQHQEREDGSGYPLAIQSQSIHLYAKIVAITDIFHAMCSSKSYKSGFSPYVVLEQLISDSFGKLDPGFVRTFVDGMTQFSLGTNVELHDGSVGKIVFVDPSQPTRPMVEVNGKIINLSLNRNIYIKAVLI